MTFLSFGPSSRCSSDGLGLSFVGLFVVVVVVVVVGACVAGETSLCVCAHLHACDSPGDAPTHRHNASRWVLLHGVVREFRRCSWVCSFRNFLFPVNLGAFCRIYHVNVDWEDQKAQRTFSTINTFESQRMPREIIACGK